MSKKSAATALALHGRMDSAVKGTNDLCCNILAVPDRRGIDADWFCRSDGQKSTLSMRSLNTIVMLLALSFDLLQLLPR